MRKTALFALALIATATTVTPTVAQASDPATVSSIVQTADLDLASSDGRRELDRRIARAARDVCGVASDADLAGKNAVHECRTDTLAQVASQREQLLAAARTGAPIQIALAR